MGIGGAFLAWPALLDLAGWTLGHGQVSSPTFVAGLATLVGAFAGLCDGLGQVFDFRRRGAGEFLLDVTWGLPGTSLAMLVHLSNFGWGQPVCVGRPGAHRYRSGFRLKGRFAVTLGSACSNLGEHWDQPLFEHERVHVAQNRRFGPFYTWTYAAWFMLLLPFAIAAGLRRGNLEAAAMEYCYYNNPWEEWAYRVGGWRPDEVVWPPQEQAPRYAAFFLGCGAAAAWLATRL